MGEFIPHEKLSKKEKCKLDLAKRQRLNPRHRNARKHQNP